MTLNGIVNRVIKPIAEEHLQLNDFGFGDLANYAASNTIKYPILWTSFKNVRYSGKQFRYTLAFVFADICKDDLANELEIQSDMIQVAADVAAEINNSGFKDVEFLEEFTLIPFVERFTDLTAGVVMEVVILSDKLLDPCEVPKK
jgi:hypothetical protein